MKIVIIAGMHRSGTSVVTQWLNKCGLQTGVYNLGPSSSNLDGHFEDTEFVRLHEDVLTDNELPETGLTEHPIRYISDYNRLRFEYLFQLKNEFFDQWGWKDPRNCLFLRYYKNNYPQAKYLFIFRDYKSVVSSLIIREFKEVEQKYSSRNFCSRFVWKTFRKKKQFEKLCHNKVDFYLKIWIAYNEQIINIIPVLDNKNYILLSYSLLHTKDNEVYNYLCENWMLDLDYVPFSRVFKSDRISTVIDVDNYIANRLLFEKARILERQFQTEILVQNFNLYA